MVGSVVDYPVEPFSEDLAIGAARASPAHAGPRKLDGPHRVREPCCVACLCLSCTPAIRASNAFITVPAFDVCFQALAGDAQRLRRLLALCAHRVYFEEGVERGMALGR